MHELETKKREKKIFRTTLIGSIANFLLLLFKFVAGIVGHSAAMTADAVHSLSDFITDIIVIAFIRISNKPEDEDHDYGHGKYETLATTFIGVILLVIGIGIFWGGAQSIYVWLKGEELESPGTLALIAALLSIFIKEILFQYTKRTAKITNSQAVEANSWHHRSDAFSSVGTAIGIGGAIFLGEQWRVLDPIAAVIVSFFIMHISIKLIIPTLEELLEKSLPKEVENKIIEIVLSFPGVSNPHQIRTRQIGNYYAIEMHIDMDGKLTLEEVHQVTVHIENKLRDVFGKKTHIGIHVEPK
ncbi:MAG: cation transporter [Bacteroidales bacterium]|nr:cation transporter [Bacteroidales bacterium]